MFCEHCGKDITDDKCRYDDISLFDDIFGDVIYDIELYEKYFGKRCVSFDMCTSCFQELQNKLLKETADFIGRGSKDDNN